MHLPFPRRAALRAISMAVFALAFFAGNAQAQQLNNRLKCAFWSEGNAATGFTTVGDRFGTATFPVGTDGRINGVATFTDGIDTYRYTVNMALAPSVPTGSTMLVRLRNNETTANTIAAREMLFFKQRLNYMFDRHAIVPAVVSPLIVSNPRILAFCEIGLGLI